MALEIVFFVVVVIFFFALLSSIRILKEYERGVKLSMGRFTGVVGPGLVVVVPFIDQAWQTRIIPLLFIILTLVVHLIIRKIADKELFDYRCSNLILYEAGLYWLEQNISIRI